MNFSLLYTSRRPWMIAPVMRDWVDKCLHAHGIEFVLTADSDDRETAQAMEKEARVLKGYHGNVLGPFASDIPGTCVKGWNLAASKSTGDVLIAISDDFVPPENWDESLEKVIDSWIKSTPLEISEFVVLVSDGYQDRMVATLPIMSRARYERLGYLYHPAYSSMYADNDLAEHAKQDGVLIEARQLVFKHEHYVNQLRKRDSVDEIHGSPSRSGTGRRIFEARRSLGFPVDIGPKAEKTTPEIPLNFIAYLQVAGDEFTLTEICQRLFEEGVRAFFFSVPDAYWNGSPVRYEDVCMVTQLALAMSGTCDVHVQHPSVADYRGKEAANIADVEARLRNSALAEIKKLGYRHVLVVDADELWKKGTLAKLQSMILKDAPPYIGARCTPVIDGWPVEGATDKVGLYIDAERNRYLSCRGAYMGGAEMEGVNVIHFTATRRTREELVAKMRASGHYDDGNYAFERWITNTLPGIRPGSKDVHMYVQGKNIWPDVRSWTKEELSEIPESLHQYLKK